MLFLGVVEQHEQARSPANFAIIMFISEQDKEQFLRLLNDTEAWLYEEGDDETKTVYNKKLEELKKHGDPIFKRVKEFEGRSAAFDHLGAVVVCHDGKLT